MEEDHEEQQGLRRCTYCKQIGHNILSCSAPGADAERRRRATRVEQKKKAVVPPPRALGSSSSFSAEGRLVSNSMPEEFLARQRIRSEGPAVREQIQIDQVMGLFFHPPRYVSNLGCYQNREYEESLKRDRELEEEAEREKVWRSSLSASSVY